MNSDALHLTNRLLKIVVALLLRGPSDEPLTLRQKVAILAELGLKPAEIADVLGRTNTYVSKELSGIRKTQKK